VTSKILTTIVDTFGHQTWSPINFRVIPHCVNTCRNLVRQKSQNFRPILSPNNLNTFNPNVPETTTMGKDKRNKKDKPKEGSFIMKTTPKSNNVKDAMAWAAAQEVSRSEAVKLAAATKAKRKNSQSPMSSKAVRKILVPFPSPSRRHTGAPSAAAPPSTPSRGGPPAAPTGPSTVHKPPNSMEVAGSKATFASMMSSPLNRRAGSTSTATTGGDNGSVAPSSLAASAALMEDPLLAALAKARGTAARLSRTRSSSTSEHPGLGDLQGGQGRGLRGLPRPRHAH
jgi:hypothetical protein